MKIRFTTCVVGPTTFIRAGDIVDVEEKEALRHIANGNGYAVPDAVPTTLGVVPPHTGVEAAAVNPAENAAAPDADTVEGSKSKETATAPAAKKAK